MILHLNHLLFAKPQNISEYKKTSIRYVLINAMLMNIWNKKKFAWKILMVVKLKIKLNVLNVCLVLWRWMAIAKHFVQDNSYKFLKNTIQLLKYHNWIQYLIAIKAQQILNVLIVLLDIFWIYRIIHVNCQLQNLHW